MSVPLLTPEEAAARVADGALLLDVRREATRRDVGTVAAAVPIDREQLDRDFGAGSPDRLPESADPARPVVLFCSSERGSGPIAEKLIELGFTDVSHVLGGFTAWKEQGLPTVEPGGTA